MNTDIAIIGGGPAGLAAACAAYDNGIRDMLIIERADRLGGILNQCIHNGFGLHKFGEELTGPEYAKRYEDMVRERGIPYITDTMVIDISADKKVTCVNSQRGIIEIEAKAIILAMGCRERPRGALNIPGYRPAGLFSAGTAQKLVNLMGYMPGREIVILGSGDIGFIMARRMTLEGAKVKAVCEILPYSGGLARNIKQCLDDFGIPLKLSHTITCIHGKDRVTGVTVAEVDENRRPISGTEEYFACDTVLFSCGLIPENELTENAGIETDKVTGGAVVDETRQTSFEGVFACGNVLHVHDLVDYVSDEAAIAGKSAADHIKNGFTRNKTITVKTGGAVRYTVPQQISKRGDVTVYFRVGRTVDKAEVIVSDRNGEILKIKKHRMAPGEMETIKLPESVYDRISGGEIKISASEV